MTLFVFFQIYRWLGVDERDEKLRLSRGRMPSPPPSPPGGPNGSNGAVAGDTGRESVVAGLGAGREA
jgi:hypothetical protein